MPRQTSEDEPIRVRTTATILRPRKIRAQQFVVNAIRENGHLPLVATTVVRAQDADAKVLPHVHLPCEGGCAANAQGHTPTTHQCVIVRMTCSSSLMMQRLERVGGNKYTHRALHLLHVRE